MPQCASTAGPELQRKQETRERSAGLSAHETTTFYMQQTDAVYLL